MRSCTPLRGFTVLTNIMGNDAMQVLQPIVATSKTPTQAFEEAGTESQSTSVNLEEQIERQLRILELAISPQA